MLGNVSVGNPGFFLDKVFALIDKSEDSHKYLFLNTIREIIINDSKCLKDYILELSELLLKYTTHSEESIRSIVAESIGRLFCTYPDEMVESISNGLQKGSELVKETLAKSVKYCVQKDLEDAKLLQSLAIDLVDLRKEAKLNIKKNALEGLTTIVHYDWTLIKD
jgi:hypothetical protein